MCSVIFGSLRSRAVLHRRLPSYLYDDKFARLATWDQSCQEGGMPHADAAHLPVECYTGGNKDRRSSCFHSSTLTEGKPPRGPRRPGNAIAPAPRATSSEGNVVIKEGEGGTWIPVLHKQTGLTYWWNEQSGETTALGEPQPGPLGRRQAPIGIGQPVTLGRALVSMVAMGAGVGLVFGIIGRIF